MTRHRVLNNENEKYQNRKLAQEEKAAAESTAAEKEAADAAMRDKEGLKRADGVKEDEIAKYAATTSQYQNQKQPLRRSYQLGSSKHAATTSQYQNRKQPLRRRRSYQLGSYKHAATSSQWISNAIFSYGVSVFAIIPGLLKVVESQTYKDKAAQLLGTVGAGKVKSFVSTLSDKLTYLTAGQLENHVETEKSQKEKRDALLSDIKETIKQTQDQFKELQEAQEEGWFKGQFVARSIEQNRKDIDKLKNLINNKPLSLLLLGLILGGFTVSRNLILRLWDEIKTRHKRNANKKINAELAQKLVEENESPHGNLKSEKTPSIPAMYYLDRPGQEVSTDYPASDVSDVEFDEWSVERKGEMEDIEKKIKGDEKKEERRLKKMKEKQEEVRRLRKMKEYVDYVTEKFARVAGQLARKTKTKTKTKTKKKRLWAK